MGGHCRQERLRYSVRFAFTAERPSFYAAQAVPPLSGDFLDTINRALGIIEMQSRSMAAPLPPRTISLAALLPSSKCALETPLVDPVSLPLDDAPFTVSETICMPPAPLLEDAPLALKEAIYFHDYLPATGCYYIGEEENNDYIGENFTGDPAALEERGALEHVSAGIVEEGASDEPEPFTAAQQSEINRTFTNSFAGFIDQIIGKVQYMITNELQTSFEPVCCDLKNQIELLRNEVAFKLAPVQNGMKRYCFKRNSDNLQPKLVRHDDNLMQIDQLHVENSFELVRYFEKLVEDEVSACYSAPYPSDSNLMHSDQIDTGETLQDCIDFDELMNDFHSTAASAQLLQQTLSGSLGPTPSGGDDGPNILALVPDT